MSGCRISQEPAKSINELRSVGSTSPHLPDADAEKACANCRDAAVPVLRVAVGPSKTAGVSWP
jgi:hypothetical protein